MYPSIPSVMDAAMKSADASNSFSPFCVAKRLLESTQISSGMLKIRVIVMEFGRFTRKDDRTSPAQLNYPPACWLKQFRIRGAGVLSEG
jgi:hypothetical protein